MSFPIFLRAISSQTGRRSKNESMKRARNDVMWASPIMNEAASAGNEGAEDANG